MDGETTIEASGFGICLRTAILPSETPSEAADRLVLDEDNRRHALQNSSKKDTFKSEKLNKEISTFNDSLIMINKVTSAL